MQLKYLLPYLTTFHILSVIVTVRTGKKLKIITDSFRTIRGRKLNTGHGCQCLRSSENIKRSTILTQHCATVAQPRHVHLSVPHNSCAGTRACARCLQSRHRLLRNALTFRDSFRSYILVQVLQIRVEISWNYFRTKQCNSQYWAQYFTCVVITFEAEPNFSKARSKYLKSLNDLTVHTGTMIL